MNQENQGYGVPVQSQQPMQQPVQQPFTQPMMQQPVGFGTPVMPNQQPKKKKIGLIIGCIVLALIAVFVAFYISIGNGDLVCTGTINGNEEEYTYSFSNSEVTKIKRVVKFDGNKLNLTEEQLDAELNAAKNLLEGQNFKVSIKRDGLVATLEVEMDADDALKAGVISDKKGDKSGTKSLNEKNGLTCK